MVVFLIVELLKFELLKDNEHQQFNKSKFNNCIEIQQLKPQQFNNYLSLATMIPVWVLFLAKYSTKGLSVTITLLKSEEACNR